MLGRPKAEARGRGKERVGHLGRGPSGNGKTELGRGLLGFGAGLRRKEAGAGLQAEAKREGNGPTWLGPRGEGKEAGRLAYGPGWRKREWPS